MRSIKLPGSSVGQCRRKSTKKVGQSLESRYFSK
jgi:hypothetical protein